jgi:hypothetical protein
LFPAFERPDLRAKVIQCSEIQQQLHAAEPETAGGDGNEQLVPVKKVGLATARQLLEAFYNCHYDQFFRSLAKLEA